MMREGKSAGMLLIGMMAVGMLLGGLAQGLAEAARITKEPTGFNGYTWGTPLVQVAGLTRVTDPAERRDVYPGALSVLQEPVGGHSVDV